MASQGFLSPISRQLVLPPIPLDAPPPVIAYLKRLHPALAAVIDAIVYQLSLVQHSGGMSKSYGSTQFTVDPMMPQTAISPILLGADPNGHALAVMAINGAPQTFQVATNPGIGFWHYESGVVTWGTPTVVGDWVGYLWAEGQ